MKIQWKKLIICILIPLAVGGASAFLTSGLAVSCGMDYSLCPHGYSFVSCTCKRKKPGPCSYSLRNTTVFQLCLAYHLLQHGSLSAGIYMAGSDVDSHHRHNHSVQKSIESGRFASDSLYTVGRLCGISQFRHISFELIPRTQAKPLLRKSNRLFHNFS